MWYVYHYEHTATKRDKPKSSLKVKLYEIFEDSDTWWILVELLCCQLFDFQSFAKLWRGLFKHIFVALEPEIPKKCSWFSVTFGPDCPRGLHDFIIQQMVWWFPRLWIFLRFSTKWSKSSCFSNRFPRASSKVDQKNNKPPHRSSFSIQGKPLLSSGTLCRRASFCIHSSLGTRFLPTKNPQWICPTSSLNESASVKLFNK